jgi:hypothetical protein
MTNVVPFPICTKDEDGCRWYAGERYEHYGEIKAAVPTREWRCIVERDTLQRLGQQKQRRRGGSAA